MNVRKLLLIAGCFLGICLGSCKEDWDNHYENNSQGEASAISQDNLYDYLKSVPEYSKFMELMDQTGVGKELAKNQVLTAWVVSNDHMPDLNGFSAEELERLARHHINYMALYSPKLEDGKVIKPMSNKNLIMRAAGDSYTLDGAPLVKANQLCANGVAHEIGDLMIPRDNIYEYIEKAGDDYSIFRDSLLVYNDTIFDMVNSFPLGVDEYGNTIYDSVFVIQNKWFERGDFRDENESFTLFLPENTQIQAAIQDIIGLYGGDVTEEERQIFFDWVMEAALYEGLITNYNAQASLTSVWNCEWRTDKQLVHPDIYAGSNGLIYTVSHLHIPRNLLLEDIFYDPVDCAKKLSDEEKSRYFVIENATSIDYAKSNYGVFFWIERSFNDDTPMSAEFTILIKDRFGRPKPARFFAGEYKFTGNIRPYAIGKFDIYVNDELYVEQITPSSINAANSETYGPVGEGVIKIPESTPVTTLRIRFETNNYSTDLKCKRLTLRGLKFSPDKSIY